MTHATVCAAAPSLAVQASSAVTRARWRRPGVLRGHHARRGPCKATAPVRCGEDPKRDAPGPLGGGGPLRSRFRRMADVFDRMENEFASAFGETLPSPRDLFEGPLPSSWTGGMRVAMDVKEHGDRYELTADVPGLSKEDISIQVRGDRVLVISGERTADSEDKGDGYYRMERSYGKFMRSFELPKDADEHAVKAKAENGVLSVSIPKKPDKDEPSVQVIDIE